MGNSVLCTGDYKRWSSGNWLQPLDDGYHRVGASRSYTLLNTGSYSGSTQIAVGIDSPKTGYISNNCVQDNNTGLMWLAGLPSGIGPDSDGRLRWDDHCDVVALTGVSGSFVSGDLVTQSASISAVIRYWDSASSEISVINASATFTASATITSDSATATVISHTQGDGEDIWSYCKAVNEAEVAGYSDWRVPNFLEAASILYADYTAANGYPDDSYWDVSDWTSTIHFFTSSHPSSTHANFWSLVPYYFNSLRDRRKFRDTGFTYLVRGPVTGTWPCRLLRTGCTQQALGEYPDDGYYQAGDPRSYEEVVYATGFFTFEIPGTSTDLTIDETYVRDLQTGLCWSKGCVVGFISGSSGEVSYSDESGVRYDAWWILNKLNELEFCGYKDWRIPTLFEVATICDFTTSACDLDSDVFDNATLQFYLCTEKPTTTTNVFRQGGSNSPWGTGVTRSSVTATYVRVVRG